MIYIRVAEEEFCTIWVPDENVVRMRPLYGSGVQEIPTGKVNYSKDLVRWSWMESADLKSVLLAYHQSAWKSLLSERGRR